MIIQYTSLKKNKIFYVEFSENAVISIHNNVQNVFEIDLSPKLPFHTLKTHCRNN